MSGEFRARDGVLAGCYLFFLTLNLVLPVLTGMLWSVVLFALFGLIGGLSILVVTVKQLNGTDDTRFNPFCFGAFLLLMGSLVGLNFWIVVEGI